MFEAEETVHVTRKRQGENVLLNGRSLVGLQLIEGEGGNKGHDKATD